MEPEPDVNEGDAEARAVCERDGHDRSALPMDMPGEFCVQCGAEWSAAALEGPDA